MPYDNIGELPDAVRSRYSPRCQKVFMDAFNRAMSGGGIGGKQDEAGAFKVAHTAAGMCKGAGKAASIQPMKAAALDPDEMDAWYAGKMPRRLLVIPFGGPIQGPDGKGRDMDLEYFDERTDIKPDWFDARPVDWHHSQDPSGLLNGALIGKADRLGAEDGTRGEPDEFGWWTDLWLNAGERRIAAVKALQRKGAELFGSSYAYPNLVKRGKAGHIDVWPYMMQTLSTSPQNIYSTFGRPAKAVLDAFTQADIAVEPILADVLTELATLRDLDANLTGEAAAKAGRELSGANLSEMEEWREMLESIMKRTDAMLKRVRSKYEKKPGDVSST
jgi:cation transport regulator ChaB